MQIWQLFTTLKQPVHISVNSQFSTGVDQLFGVKQRLRVTPPFITFFYIFCRKLKEKVVLASKKQKQMILTSELRAEHPFAG